MKNKLILEEADWPLEMLHMAYMVTVDAPLLYVLTVTRLVAPSIFVISNQKTQSHCSWGVIDSACISGGVEEGFLRQLKPSG